MSSKKGDKKNSAPNGMVRGNCSATEGSASSASKLLACSRRGLVVYCSRDCQKAHWKANHEQLSAALYRQGWPDSVVAAES